MNHCRRIVTDRSSANSFCLARQILGDERQWRWILLQILYQQSKSFGYVGVRPIIPDSVAQAIGPCNTHRALLAVVVSLPVPRILNHHSLDDCTNIRTLLAGYPFLFNASETEDCFPHHECQFGADFQNAEMSADELTKRLRRLIVRGVSFKDDPFVLQN